MVKNSLKYLDLSLNNDIGDNGIAAIAGALCSSQISGLCLFGCGITLTGAKSLAAGLLVNKSVKKLDVKDNSITVKGACLILQSAVNNGVCQEVLFTKLYCADDEVKMMMLILEQRKIKEV